MTSPHFAFFLLQLRDTTLLPPGTASFCCERFPFLSCVDLSFLNLLLLLLQSRDLTLLPNGTASLTYSVKHDFSSASLCSFFLF